MQTFCFWFISDLTMLNHSEILLQNCADRYFDHAAKCFDMRSRWRDISSRRYHSTSAESSRIRAREWTTTSEGRRRLAGKTDHPDVYPSLWCHVLKSTGKSVRERKRVRATTSARRDAFIDARNRRFRGAGQRARVVIAFESTDDPSIAYIEIRTNQCEF